MSEGGRHSDPAAQPVRPMPEGRRSSEQRKRRRDRNGESQTLRRMLSKRFWMWQTLRFSGLLRPGWRSLMNPVLVRDEIFLRSLPPALDGLRILHLSDFHFDLTPSLASVVKPMLEGLEYDLCVVTGDFRDSLNERGDAGVRLSSELLAPIAARLPVYACLGNHDLWRDVALLTAAGIRILVNENAVFERDGGVLHICGVDDPGFHRTDDFDAAFSCVPEGSCSLALVHNPCAHEAARAHGASLMLCGHTHGGQICLPFGIPILSHSGCPRRMVSGHWQDGEMQGYTSRGLGANRIPARLFCRGEISIHTLRRQLQPGI